MVCTCLSLILTPWKVGVDLTLGVTPSSIKFSALGVIKVFALHIMYNQQISKHDGSPLSSDHVIKASPVLVTILPPLYTAFVRHSYLPPNLRNRILKPIPKPHKDPTLSDSYRSIALAPTLSKILEWCILLQYSEYFAISPLQFGFKKHMSTALCTGLVKNISAHYMSHSSSVFACLLDASKAFDLDHSLLFQQLLQRRTPSFFSSLVVFLGMVPVLVLLMFLTAFVKEEFCPLRGIFGNFRLILTLE